MHWVHGLLLALALSLLSLFENSLECQMLMHHLIPHQLWALTTVSWETWMQLSPMVFDLMLMDLHLLIVSLAILGAAVYPS